MTITKANNTHTHTHADTHMQFIIKWSLQSQGIRNVAKRISTLVLTLKSAQRAKETASKCDTTNNNCNNNNNLNNCVF